MTVSYLTTVGTIAEAEGLRYAEITKAMRVHVRSLVAEGYVAAFAGDDSVTTLDDPEGVVWLTEPGMQYYVLLVEAGLINEASRAQVETAQEPKATRSRKSRRRRSTQPKAAATVPTPEESVKVTELAPSKKGPQPTEAAVEVPALGATHPVTTVTVGERMTALEGRLETLTAALEVLVGGIS